MLFPYILSISDGIWYFSVMFLAASILMLLHAILLLGTAIYKW